MANFEAQSDRDAGGKHLAPQGNKSVLLCDDEAQDRRELAATIASPDLEICEVSSPEQAREIFPSRYWSLVIIHSALNPEAGLLYQWRTARGHSN
jgi:DNA-binding NtrC family response regulator